MDEIGWIVGASGAIVAAVVTIWNLFFKTHRDLRVDALNEYEDIVTRLDTRNNELHTEVLGMYKSHAECMKENAEIRAQITILEAKVIALEDALKSRENVADKLATQQSQERQQANIDAGGP